VEAGGIEGLQKLVDEEFLSKVTARFNEMYVAFKETKERNSPIK
jgi:hypothetical protein